MTIEAIDHVALPMERVDDMLAFYRSLGFDVRDALPPLYWTVHCGMQKINLHGPDLWRSPDFDLRGPSAEPGCGDLCFVWSGSEAELAGMIEAAGAAVVEGPVTRDGGRGDGTSTYVRDPDGNLLEFIVYPERKG